MNKFLILFFLLVGVCAIPPPPPTTGKFENTGCILPGPEGVILKQKLNITSPIPHQVEAIMLNIVLPPGDLGLNPHTHPGPVVGYVMEGELMQQVKNGPITIVKAGQTFYEKDGDVHVWSANALDDATTRVLVAVWARPGEELTTYVDLGYTRETREEAIKMAVRKM